MILVINSYEKLKECVKWIKNREDQQLKGENKNIFIKFKCRN